MEEALCLSQPTHLTSHSSHLGLVPSLSLRPAPLGNQLVLGLDLSNDAVQVKSAIVVHGKDHIGVRHVGLYLAQLLHKKRQLPPAPLLRDPRRQPRDEGQGPRVASGGLGSAPASGLEGKASFSLAGKWGSHFYKYHSFLWIYRFPRD